MVSGKWISVNSLCPSNFWHLNPSKTRNTKHALYLHVPPITFLKGSVFCLKFWPDAILGVYIRMLSLAETGCYLWMPHLRWVICILFLDPATGCLIWMLHLDAHLLDAFARCKGCALNSVQINVKFTMQYLHCRYLPMCLAFFSLPSFWTKFELVRTLV